MNYYERHLGDYAKDTAHLSIMEHGVYTLLLDRYYSTEHGIPEDQAHRVARARTRDERAAVDAVLSEFFTLKDGVWVKGRVEEEIVRARKSIEAARENGKRGGRPKKPDPIPEETQQKPNGFSLGSEMETQSKAHQTPDTRYQENPPTPRNRGEPIPYDEIVTAYNATMTRLPKVLVLNDARKRAIRRAWEESPQRRSVEEFWVPYFEECEASSFHNGTGPYTNGHENWRPDFDFLVQPKTITKVYERAMQRVERRPDA